MNMNNSTYAISRNYKIKKLVDVASYERAITGKVYPRGTTLIQISATRGQTIYLDNARKVESHYVAVIPEEVDPYYLYIVITKAIPDFCRRYQTGLNIQAKSFDAMEVEIHDLPTQRIVAAKYKAMEEAEKKIEKEIKSLEEIKKYMLANLFV